MPIKIDEHTVAGCPSCHSTDLEEQTYLNHLTCTDVHVTRCNHCGLIFEPSDAVRISKLSEVDEVTKMKETIKDLEYRVMVLERKFYH
jgi:hypothetical protein